jgi:arsenite methyltransferase
MAICDKTFQIYNREPYAGDILPIVPNESISLEEAAAFDCRRSALRDPRETKGLDYDVTDLSGAACCEPGRNCC